jgi:hypothetical protein
MWIASALGFFSIVKKDGAFHVRARCRTDLVALEAAAGLTPKIIVSPDADYHYRILVGPEAIPNILRALGDSVTYPNFKSAIAHSPTQYPKLRAYESFWWELKSLQDRHDH